MRARAAAGRRAGHPGIHAAAECAPSRRSTTGIRGTVLPADRRRDIRRTRSVSSTCRNRCANFPARAELADAMRAGGFDPVEWEYLTFGIAALHVGRVPA